MTKKNITAGMTDKVLTEEEAKAIEALDLEALGEPAAEAAPGTEAPEPAAPEAEVPAPTVDARPLADIVAEVTPAQLDAKITDINTAFDNREAFEKLHASANDSIQDKLKAERKRMALPGIATLMVATQIDANFLNREINAGKRFNIYAVNKLTDILHGLNSGHFKNAINIAVMKSMFKFRKAGMAFTGSAVLGAASDKVKVDKAMAAVLVRHTVSPSTAPTQSSSTMNALATIGAVRNIGSTKFPIWELTDSPVCKKLEALLAA